MDKKEYLEILAEQIRYKKALPMIEKELEEEGIVPYCPKSVQTALQRNF